MNRRRLLSALALAVAISACGTEEFPSPTVGPPPSGLPEAMLAAHNQARAAAAPAPSPPLAALSWSPEVAATARAWADGCAFAHNPDLASLGYGENLAATAPSGSRGASDVVGLWLSEAPFYDYASNTCDTGAANPAETCGHYTQLVSRSTTAVGCAFRTCTTGSPFPSFPTWDLWVCDYAPPGNLVGQRPY
jgi:hypothetical protein